MNKIYIKGDVIREKYEVYEKIGEGGFGIVYLVYSNATGGVYALKTFRDEYIENKQMREKFKVEAELWVAFERHPFLVRASFVDILDNRLYIAMEYIAPDELGINSLSNYMAQLPVDTSLSLRWGIQFCYGIEYAYSKGLRCHRDIKPANIMLTQEKQIKINDFGIAGILDIQRAEQEINLTIRNSVVGLSYQTFRGISFGTPTHMSPEQFINAAECDERSDIYSFGIVLFQLVANGSPPFSAPLPKDSSESEMQRFWVEMYKLHNESPVPNLDSPISFVIQRCLEKDPSDRYQSFKQLRIDLEKLLINSTGEIITVPKREELDWWEMGNKGRSLDCLGHKEEAIVCYEQAIELNPEDPISWFNKGISLHNFNRYEEAILCFNEALKRDKSDWKIWHYKGNTLNQIQCYEEAITCLEKAISINPQSSESWYYKGLSFASLNQLEEEISCIKKSLEIEPKNARAWQIKATAEVMLDREDAAAKSYNNFLDIATEWDSSELESAREWLKKYDARLLNKKGLDFQFRERYEQALNYFEKAVSIDPINTEALSNKAYILCRAGDYNDAINTLDKIISLKSDDGYAWYYKGICLYKQKEYVKSISCFNQAIKINSSKSVVWYNLALAEDALDKQANAIYAFKRALELATSSDNEHLKYARKRLEELNG